MPERRITIVPHPKHLQVFCQGVLIADSARALILEEEGHGPVRYFPRADVTMAALTPSAHRTRCPYKGEASYFSIDTGKKIFENAVWSYETPIDAVSAIKSYLAFYPDKVRISDV